MKVQIILEKKLEPIRFERAKCVSLSNKAGLKIMGIGYSEIYPLEKIKSIMVVDNENMPG